MRSSWVPTGTAVTFVPTTATNARDKLKESAYFLARMHDAVSDRDPFRFNLSAFLAASRSVVYHLRRQYGRQDSFKAWINAQEERLKKEPIAGLMFDKRRLTIHEVPVQPRAVHYLTAHATMTVAVSVSAVVLHADGTQERTESPPSNPSPLLVTPPTGDHRKNRTEWFFSDEPDRDVLSLAQDYLRILEAVVDECETRF